MPIKIAYKIVDNKLQVSSLTSYDTPLTKEYSLEELNQRLMNAQTALQSWQEELVNVNQQIITQLEQIESCKILIAKAVDMGLVINST